MYWTRCAASCKQATGAGSSTCTARNFKTLTLPKVYKLISCLKWNKSIYNQTKYTTQVVLLYKPFISKVLPKTLRVWKTLIKALFISTRFVYAIYFSYMVSRMVVGVRGCKSLQETIAISNTISYVMEWYCKVTKNGNWMFYYFRVYLIVAVKQTKRARGSVD